MTLLKISSYLSKMGVFAVMVSNFPQSLCWFPAGAARCSVYGDHCLATQSKQPEEEGAVARWAWGQVLWCCRKLSCRCGSQINLGGSCFTQRWVILLFCFFFPYVCVCFLLRVQNVATCGWLGGLQHTGDPGPESIHSWHVCTVLGAASCRRGMSTKDYGEQQWPQTDRKHLQLMFEKVKQAEPGLLDLVVLVLNISRHKILEFYCDFMWITQSCV